VRSQSNLNAQNNELYESPVLGPKDSLNDEETKVLEKIQPFGLEACMNL
jgi:hypothetical protein